MNLGISRSPVQAFDLSYRDSKDAHGQGERYDDFQDGRHDEFVVVVVVVVRQFHFGTTSVVLFCEIRDI
jgi:hypothetical protein